MGKSYTLPDPQLPYLQGRVQDSMVSRSQQLKGSVTLGNLLVFLVMRSELQLLSGSQEKALYTTGSGGMFALVSTLSFTRLSFYSYHNGIASRVPLTIPSEMETRNC